ncbi:MAG: YggS family pyridoxal phosphate-dependent enzyme [Verrucomicrobia bacterium]|nr:YggS family pyridoxal phosphate-dependent enzyme [Verrucomicrobiota bacterium]
MLSESYSRLLSQIQMCATAAGRNPSSIHLVAVTKYASFEQMEEAYDAGIRHFGESRLQVALTKMQLFPNDVAWHFIGPLQSNKIGKIVEHFSYIHSVDSKETAKLIARKCKELQKRPQLFLQVNTSKESAKHGFSEEELLRDYKEIAGLDLNINGLMTMAPLTPDAEVIRPCFSRLRQLRDQLGLSHLSMGMTQDYPIAVAEGATFLRIGSLLFQN